MHCGPSYQRKFTTNRLNKLRSIFKGNRRVANGAVRKFIEQLDIVSDGPSRQLYSCAKCEVPMVDSDFKQLDIDRVSHGSFKKLLGVVIDAKVVHLLKEGHEVNDCHDQLTSVTGLKTKMIGNRETQAAVKLFIKTVVSKIKRKAMRGAAGGHPEDPSEDGDAVNFMLCRGDTMYFRLSAMKHHVRK